MSVLFKKMMNIGADERFKGPSQFFYEQVRLRYRSCVIR